MFSAYADDAPRLDQDNCTFGAEPSFISAVAYSLTGRFCGFSINFRDFSVSVSTDPNEPETSLLCK